MKCLSIFLIFLLFVSTTIAQEKEPEIISQLGIKLSNDHNIDNMDESILDGN